MHLLSLSLSKNLCPILSLRLRPIHSYPLSELTSAKLCTCTSSPGNPLHSSRFGLSEYYLNESFMNNSGHFELAISCHFAEIRQIVIKHVWHSQTRQSISQTETLLQAKAWQLHLSNSSRTSIIMHWFQMHVVPLPAEFLLPAHLESAKPPNIAGASYSFKMSTWRRID